MNKPTCGHCNAPVEYFESERDQPRRATVYLARCHGYLDRIDVTDNILRDEPGPADIAREWQPFGPGSKPQRMHNMQTGEPLPTRHGV
jgi:hypothetical protein